MKRDDIIFDIIEKEHQRQLKGIELIASENFVSDQVMQAMGSCLTNKYAEGYPGKRYYGGCEVVDQSEQIAIDRLKEIFAAKSLQLVSFTITEKGYALQKADGTWFPFVEADIKNGPDKATGAMAVLVAMLNERYKAGKYPIALVSMDNCSQNGAKLRESVLTMTEEWHKAGFVDDGFVDYVTDEKVVAFPWTMIDKITPRPSEQIAADLEKLGVEDMQPVITGKKTYIAPFVNAEKPQYLVIEDSFPNGRPALEKGFGVYMADRNTVNLSERMKVTVCLNPVHSATCLLYTSDAADE